MVFFLPTVPAVAKGVRESQAYIHIGPRGKPTLGTDVADKEGLPLVRLPGCSSQSIIHHILAESGTLIE